MKYVRKGNAVSNIVYMRDQNDAAVTGQTLSDLQSVSFAYTDTDGNRTAVASTATGYPTLTEIGSGLYTLAFTPTQGDVFYHLNFIFPSGSQEFSFQEDYWSADTKEYIGDTDQITHEFYMYDTAGSAVTGKTKGDFITAQLAYGSTDKDSSLTLTEIGSGLYSFSFTPGADSTGVWSMYYEQPSGTMRSTKMETWDVFGAEESAWHSEYVGDAVGTLTGQYASAMANSRTAALRWYSMRFPNIAGYTMSGDGSTRTVAYSTMTSWVTGYSRVEKVEYPSGNAPPTYLEPEQVMEYYDGSTKSLYFKDLVPASGESAIILYTCLHSAFSTVPAAHKVAVYWWAAGDAMRKLAAMCKQRNNASLGSDASMDWLARAADYSTQAETYKEEAEEFLRGVLPPKAILASTAEALGESDYWDGIRNT